MRTKYVWEKILSVSVGLMLYELAAGSSFYLMELSLILLAGSFLLEERKLFVQLPRTITALEQELKRSPFHEIAAHFGLAYRAQSF